MSGPEEQWVKAAMSDDTMVVDFLLRLQDAAAPPPTPPLDWSVRQRRSRPVSVPKKQSQRGSPTTPLSWSGATSLSGGSGGAGDEGSSTPAVLKPPRSKVNGDSERLASRRTKKKKTLAELKDDESTLLKERRQLKRQLAALRLSLEKQRASNENLKRIKIELQAKESILEQYDEMATAGAIVSDKTVRSQPLKSDGSYEPNTKYVLPDLNMTLEEQHSFL